MNLTWSCSSNHVCGGPGVPEAPVFSWFSNVFHLRHDMESTFRSTRKIYRPPTSTHPPGQLDRTLLRPVRAQQLGLPGLRLLTLTARGRCDCDRPCSDMGDG